MLVLMVERVTPSLRGELTRWLLEARPGIFVGRVSAMVRDKLWDRVCRALKGRSAATLVYASDTEQGFTIRQVGEATRVVRDFEGLQLITTP